tara:strand:- start:843 stop:1985 length:1143 start_codon:yes stop_codon:yes gene_type:complete
MKKNALIILAAGESQRFDKTLQKQFIKIGKYNPIEHILNNIKNNKEISNIVIVFNKNQTSKIKKIIKKYKDLKIILTKGGKNRQESSFNGLKAIKKINPKKVLIHDACRPYILNSEINKIINKLDKYDACAPIIKNVDLVRIKNQNDFNEFKSDLYLIQTPQGFNYKKIFNAHLEYPYINSKDDIELLNNKINKINYIQGNKKNIKITYYNDIKFFDFLDIKSIKYGIGYDIHKINFNSKKKLILCGHKINFYPLIGHSDADVGYHAICDSIFGALGIGDIGKFFNDKNPKWKNVNSKIFLLFAKNKLNEKNYEILNIDINFICEKPKISKYSYKMIENISKILKIKKSKINIKATTNEKVSFIGRGEAIAAESIVCISK